MPSDQRTDRLDQPAALPAVQSEERGHGHHRHDRRVFGDQVGPAALGEPGDQFGAAPFDQAAGPALVDSARGRPRWAAAVCRCSGPSAPITVAREAIIGNSPESARHHPVDQIAPVAGIPGVQLLLAGDRQQFAVAHDEPGGHAGLQLHLGDSRPTAGAARGRPSRVVLRRRLRTAGRAGCRPVGCPCAGHPGGGDGGAHEAVSGVRAERSVRHVFDEADQGFHRGGAARGRRTSRPACRPADRARRAVRPAM